MAKELRSKTNGKPPIMRHPLFPATVALWFGALFGLSSLAIRPSLLESAVLALHLDAFVAAAAPPLGVTARILLATCMAAFGGFLGAMLARRIARPKPVIRERKRGANAVGNAHRPSRHPHFAATADETDHAAKEETPRRRQLAIKEQEEVSSRPEYQEPAPLPGAAPQILDVSEFDLEGFQAEEECEFERKSPDQDNSAPHDRTEAEGRDFAEAPPQDTLFVEPAPATVAQPDHGEIAGAGPREQSERTVDEPAPFDSPAATASTPLKNGLFDAYSQGVAPSHEGETEVDASKPAPFAQPAAGDTGEVAEEPALPRPDEARLANDEAPAAQGDDHRSIFTPNPAPRLFSEPVQAEVTDAGWSQEDTLGARSPALFMQPSSEDAGAQDHEADAEMSSTALFGKPAGGQEPESDRDVADLPAEAEPGADEHRQDDNAAPGRTPAQTLEESNSEPMHETTAAERIANAELSELSQVELLERLALSLQRSNKRTDSVEATPTAAPQAAGEAEVEPENEDNGSGQGSATDNDPDEQVPFSPPSISIPAAMRPVGHAEEDENEALPSFVPPRHISMPQQPAAKVAEVGAETAAGSGDGEEPQELHLGADAPFAKPTEGQDADDEEEDDDSRVLEEGYSSLLNLSRPAAGKQQFVRIEEPEQFNDEIEPVVIFPGQENSGDAPFAHAADTAAPQATPFARPEAPEEVEGPAGSAPFAAPQEPQATAQPAPFAPPPKRQDPEETERALRAALATLQRMSGAA